MEIHWYEACENNITGETGASFNTKTKKLIDIDDIEHDISSDNIDTVKWIIDMNMEYLLERVDKIRARINQTKILKFRIQNGHRVLEVLSPELKIKFNRKLNQVHEEIEMLDMISLESLIKADKDEK